MYSKKLKLIKGGRDALEASLAQAFFKPDTAEIDRISSQINAIQQQGEQAGRSLTQQGYFAGPLRVLPDGRIYFIAFRGDTRAGLYLIEPGQAARKLRDVVAGSRLDASPVHMDVSVGIAE